MSMKELVSSLLILVALFAVVTVPYGMGQSLTTVVETVTTPYVVVENVNSTVGTTQEVSTETHTLTESTPFVLDATHGKYGCVFKALRFTANEGDVISGQVTSDSPITFYIMSSDDYSAWAGTNSCAVQSSLFERQKVTSVPLNMVVPSTREYDLLFVNSSSDKSANVKLLFVGGYQAVATVSLPVVSAFATTYTTMSILTKAEVHTIESTLEQYGSSAAMILLIGVVVTAAAILKLRRRRKKAAPTVSTKAAVPPAVTIPADNFCGNCGIPLPPDAEFCGECGAAE